MRVCLMSLEPPDERVLSHLVVQARLFRERGDEVQLMLPAMSHELPPDLADLVADSEGPWPQSDLNIYHDTGERRLSQVLGQHDTGVVLIHDHCDSQAGQPGHAGEGGSLAAHYAELTLVDDPARRDQLVDDYGLARERVYLLPGIDQEPAYRAALAELVDHALADDWPAVPAPSVSPAPQEAATPSLAGLRSSLMLAQRQADVMLRTYTVRSRIPLLGGLVAWARRNLTSHLREPYLDPTLERQVAFNRTVVAWMEQVQARLEALESDIARLQAPPPDAEGDDRSEGTW